MLTVKPDGKRFQCSKKKMCMIKVFFSACYSGWTSVQGGRKRIGMQRNGYQFFVQNYALPNISEYRLKPPPCSGSHTPSVYQHVPLIGMRTTIVILSPFGSSLFFHTLSCVCRTCVVYEWSMSKSERGRLPLLQSQPELSVRAANQSGRRQQSSDGRKSLAHQTLVARSWPVLPGR